MPFAKSKPTTSPIVKAVSGPAVQPPVKASAKALKRVVKTASKATANSSVKPSAAGIEVEKPGKTAISPKTRSLHVPVSNQPAKPPMPLKKVPAVQPKSTHIQLLETADALLQAAVPAKKKPGRPPKAVVPEGAAGATGAKPGLTPKGAVIEGEQDLSDIVAEFAEEPRLSRWRPKRSNRCA